MRTLFLFLILANLGFFAWTHWVAPPTDDLPAGRADETLGVGLQLAGEAERSNGTEKPVVAEIEPAAEAGLDATTEAGPDADLKETEVVESGDAPEPSVADIEVRCASLGPFDQLDTADVARQRLRDAGYTARIRESGGQIRSGFWVFLPPFDSRDDAKATESRLRSKGVQDLFIVTGSENRNAISLGLFSTPERADQRAAEIGRLGFSPQISERFRDATLYWLDYRESGEDRLEPQNIGVLGADEVLPEKRSRDCDAEDFTSENTVEAIARDRVGA